MVRLLSYEGGRAVVLFKEINMAAIAVNSIIIILELIGCCISIIGTRGSSLIYYTVLSNLLGLVSSCCYVVSALRGEIPRWVTMLRYCSAVCLTVTFLVVIFVLVPMALPYGTAGDILYKGAQIYHHILCPILTFVSFVFLEGGEKLSAVHILIAAAPTLAYAVVTIILNLLKVIHGPYPFLHVYEQPWFMSVIWFTVIVGSSAGIAAVCRVLRDKFI